MNPQYQIIADRQFNLSDSLQGRAHMITLEMNLGMSTDSLTIIFDDRDQSFALPPLGSELQLRLGYLPKQGHVNPIDGLYLMGVFYLADIKCAKEGSGRMVELHATALDFLTEFKSSRSDSYENVYLNEIVWKLALRSGWSENDIYVHPDASNILIDFKAQVDCSDMSFLTGIATSYNFVCAIRNGKLIFTTKEDASTAFLTDTQLPPLKEFYIHEDDVSQYDFGMNGRGLYNTVCAEFVDTDKGISGTVLGDLFNNGIPDGFVAAKDIAGGGTPDEVQEKIKKVYPSKEEAQAAANARQVQLAATAFSFSFTGIGRPDFIPGSYIVLSEFRKQIPTRWQLQKVVHEIQDNGYRCRCVAEIPWQDIIDSAAAPAQKAETKQTDNGSTQNPGVSDDTKDKGFADPSTRPVPEDGSIPDGYDATQEGYAALDTDGSGRAALGEGTHSPQLPRTLADGTYLNGDKVAYVAQNPMTDAAGNILRDANGNPRYQYPVNSTYAYVLNTQTNKGAWAILGDNATANNIPNNRLEVSPKLASDLGVAKIDPATGRYIDDTVKAPLKVFYYPKT
jgi:phage protein D